MPHLSLEKVSLMGYRLNFGTCVAYKKKEKKRNAVISFLRAHTHLLTI
jgi:hypothetical protein